jgi:hypothetical protein
MFLIIHFTYLFQKQVIVMFLVFTFVLTSITTKNLYITIKFLYILTAYFLLAFVAKLFVLTNVSWNVTNSNFDRTKVVQKHICFEQMLFEQMCSSHLLSMQMFWANLSKNGKNSVESLANMNQRLMAVNKTSSISLDKTKENPNLVFYGELLNCLFNLCVWES